jgi:hypothetical protein
MPWSHAYEPGENGKGFKISKGDRVVIPSEWLKLSFNPINGRGRFFKHGISWFVQKLFFDGYSNTNKDFSKILARYRKQSESIVNTCDAIKHLNLEDEKEGAEAYSILEANKNTREWWAFAMGAFAEMAQEAILNSDMGTAAWALQGCERARCMLLFNVSLEEPLWMGQSAKSIIDLLKIWYSNQANDNEAFWQQTLSENAFTISQIFSIPIAIIEEKAYVGGTQISGGKGKFVDYLLQNEISGEAAIVEIKTPKKKLLSRRYRNVVNVSAELSGGILQVSDYRQSLIKSLRDIKDAHESLAAFSPRMILIIGNYSQQLTDNDKKNSFELYRRSLRDLEIITFDELFRKVETLAQLFGLTAKKKSK